MRSAAPLDWRRNQVAVTGAASEPGSSCVVDVGAALTITADPKAPACACRHALDTALITAPAARDPAMVEKLRAIASRVLGPAA